MQCISFALPLHSLHSEQSRQVSKPFNLMHSHSLLTHILYTLTLSHPIYNLYPTQTAHSTNPIPLILTHNNHHPSNAMPYNASIHPSLSPPLSPPLKKYANRYAYQNPKTPPLRNQDQQKNYVLCSMYARRNRTRQGRKTQTKRPSSPRNDKVKARGSCTRDPPPTH